MASTQLTTRCPVFVLTVTEPNRAMEKSGRGTASTALGVPLDIMNLESLDILVLSPVMASSWRQRRLVEILSKVEY